MVQLYTCEFNISSLSQPLLLVEDWEGEREPKKIREGSNLADVYGASQHYLATHPSSLPPARVQQLFLTLEESCVMKAKLPYNRDKTRVLQQ